MTEERCVKVAHGMYNENSKQMHYMRCRWLDEQEYEDFNDYVDIFKKWVDSIGGVFVKATKRPFGFTFKLDHMTFKMTATTTQVKIEWR